MLRIDAVLSCQEYERVFFRLWPTCLSAFDQSTSYSKISSWRSGTSCMTVTMSLPRFQLKVGFLAYQLLPFLFDYKLKRKSRVSLSGVTGSIQCRQVVDAREQSRSCSPVWRRYLKATTACFIALLKQFWVVSTGKNFHFSLFLSLWISEYFFRESSPCMNTCCLIHTVEPPNKGHFGSTTFVLYLEAVLWWEVWIIIASTMIISICAIAGVL